VHLFPLTDAAKQRIKPTAARTILPQLGTLGRSVEYIAGLAPRNTARNSDAAG
jgi:hypothetical protein